MKTKTFWLLVPIRPLRLCEWLRICGRLNLSITPFLILCLFSSFRTLERENSWDQFLISFQNLSQHTEALYLTWLANWVVFFYNILLYHMICIWYLTVTGISLDRFALWQSRLILVSVCSYIHFSPWVIFVSLVHIYPPPPVKNCMTKAWRTICQC